MKKFSRILIIVLIAFGFVNPVYSSDYSDEQTINEEYQNLIGEIDKNLVIDNGTYTYNYEEIKDLVYDFDIESANKHLGGDWTHETFLSEIIANINDVNIEAVSQEVVTMNTRANCQINTVNEYWNYYRIWADQENLIL